jgi:hypothetical protein
MTDSDRDLRRLCGRIRALEEENTDLRERLAYANREIELIGLNQTRVRFPNGIRHTDVFPSVLFHGLAMAA